MADILKGFIVFEGLDGSGTTTQIDALCDCFHRAGRPFFRTAEPSDGVVGRFLRESVLNGNPNHLDAESILHLYVADRHDHIYGENGVISNLKKSGVAIQDRYWFSTLAYQGVDIAYDRIFDLNKDFPYPEHLIYLKCPVDVCMQRIASRGKEREIFEKSEFLNKVADNYDRAFENLPSGVGFHVVDSSALAREVHDKLMKILAGYF